MANDKIFRTNISTNSEGQSGEEDENSSDAAARMAVMLQALQLLVQGVKNSNDDDDGNELHNITCDACGNTPIRSDCYKCLQCDNFDLCAGCFESRTESKQHKSGHLLVHFRIPNELFGRTVTYDEITFEKLKQFYAKELNESITCDGCMKSNFFGLRFKCDTCLNYDLCEKCAITHVTTKDHKLMHPLILTSHRVIVQIPADDIELGEELGSGAFGAVHKARWISKNREVTCKIIFAPDTNQIHALENSFFKELSAYTELSGGYILQTYGYVMTRQNNKRIYMIITEYMARGSLANALKEKGKISLRRKVHMARQIASGMRKIHDHHMIHRDIRSDNILVNQQYTCKIGDIGIARVTDPCNRHTQIGCQPFMPPEFYEGTYDQKLDIFTFGLTLNELFTETQHVCRQRAAEKIVFKYESPIFRDLITRCTADDPKHRPTAIEIEKTLELYTHGFDMTALKKQTNYVRLSTEQKDQVFIDFYEQFHKSATEFIRKQFPVEFLQGPKFVAGIKVQRDIENNQQVDCHVQ
ncbi:unnamed protein product [Rotaria sp. Silwood1]|nr:unnamed protein product [Rotaria sp. Silwood1]